MAVVRATRSEAPVVESEGMMDITLGKGGGHARAKVINPTPPTPNTDIDISTVIITTGTWIGWN